VRVPQLQQVDVERVGQADAPDAQHLDRPPAVLRPDAPERRAPPARPAAHLPHLPPAALPRDRPVDPQRLRRRAVGRPAHPFTAPVRPPTIRRSNAEKKTSAGIIDNETKASARAVSTEYCDANACTPSGSVYSAVSLRRKS